MKVKIRDVFGLILFWIITSPILQAQDKSLAIETVTIIDGTGNEVMENQTVLIQNGIILSIFPTGKETLPENCTVLDLSGKFILPGLIDGHTHFSPNQTRVQDLQSMLKSGITSVRDMGGNALIYKNLKEQAVQDLFQIPDIYYSATFFGPEFMVDPRVKFAAGPYEPGEAPWMRLIEEDTDISTVISEAKKAGATGIKLYSSLTAAQILAITNDAHDQGLQVYGHATIFPSKPSNLVEASPDGMSHALSLAFEVHDDLPNEFNDAIQNWLPQKNLNAIDENDDRFIKLFKYMKEKNIIFEPTISAWRNSEISPKPKEEPINSNIAKAGKQLNKKSIIDWNARITRKAILEGVKISAGTDQTEAMKWIQDEIIFLTELGMSPMEAIKAATLTNAEVMGLEGELGSVEVGKRADLLILDKNPLDDIQDIWAVYEVIKSGKLVRAYNNFTEFRD